MEGGVTSEKMVNMAMIHLSQGVKQHTEGCMALGWNLASVINDPLGAQGSTLLYICLPLKWGTAGGDLLVPQYSWECKWQPTGLQNLQKRQDSLPRRSLQEILRQGAQSLGTPSRGSDATSKPAAEISAKSRDEPIVRNLPKVISRAPLSGVSSSDIPLQGASSSSIPAEGEGLRHLASGGGRFHLAKIKLLGSTRQKIKKARSSQAGTGSNRQPRNAGIPK
jgi:hypothetical protein